MTSTYSLRGLTASLFLLIPSWIGLIIFSYFVQVSYGYISSGVGLLLLLFVLANLRAPGGYHRARSFFLLMFLLNLGLAGWLAYMTISFSVYACPCDPITIGLPAGMTALQWFVLLFMGFISKKYLPKINPNTHPATGAAATPPALTFVPTRTSNVTLRASTRASTRTSSVSTRASSVPMAAAMATPAPPYSPPAPAPAYTPTYNPPQDQNYPSSSSSSPLPPPPTFASAVAADYYPGGVRPGSQNPSRVEQGLLGSSSSDAPSPYYPVGNNTYPVADSYPMGGIYPDGPPPYEETPRKQYREEPGGEGSGGN